MSHAVRIRSALDLRLPARPGVRVHLVEDAADDPAGLPRRRVPNLALLPRMCLARATLSIRLRTLSIKLCDPRNSCPTVLTKGEGASSFVSTDSRRRRRCSSSRCRGR
jgi:hypothetical protein